MVKTRKEVFGLWLRDKREAAGFQTTRSLAQAAKLPESKVAAYERGAMPHFSDAEKLARAMGLNEAGEGAFYCMIQWARRTPRIDRLVKSIGTGSPE